MMQVVRKSGILQWQAMISLQRVDIVAIRQSSFYQVRLSLYQHSPKEHILAVPFLILKSESEPLRGSQKQIANKSEIDVQQNTFLTRKFIMRNIDEHADVDEICLFKGKWEGEGRQVRVVAELLSWQQNEVEVVGEWEGHTLAAVGSSYCPIYFNSYKVACNLHAHVHLVATALDIHANLQPAPTPLSRLQCFNLLVMPLQQSIETMKQQLVLLEANQPFTSTTIEAQVFENFPNSYRYAIYLGQTIVTQTQEEKVKKQIESSSVDKFDKDTKAAIQRYNQLVYQVWKKLQWVQLNDSCPEYFDQAQSQFATQLSHYHTHVQILTSEQPLPTCPPPSQPQQEPLFIYPFEKHETFLRLSEGNREQALATQPSSGKQLVVLVHGYQASSFDMEPLSNYLRHKHPGLLCLVSSVNEGRTEQPIQESAHRLAIEIKNYLNSLEGREVQISFICHSLGGIIARASLKYLQLHRGRFNQFVTIGSPHLGYLYHSSTLISTSLWILNKVRKDPSMIEITMEDHQQLEHTYLYGLAHSSELTWFKRIWLFGSREDEYVPYWSAVLEAKQFLFETETAKVYNELLTNLTHPIQHKLIRCEMVFNEKGRDLSNLIGRTAHIKLLNYLPGLELFSFLFKP